MSRGCTFIHFKTESAVEGGIVRYGRLLARQAIASCRSNEIFVSVSSHDDQTSEEHDFTGVESLVFQYSPYYYPSECISIIKRLSQQISEGHKHIIVVHDANRLCYPYYEICQFSYLFKRSAWKRARKLIRNIKSLRRLLHSFDPSTFVLGTFDEVQAKMLSRKLCYPCVYVPHFVETPIIRVESSYAKSELKLRNKAVLTVLGFFSPHKQHSLILKSLVYLPDFYHLVFAGGSTGSVSDYYDRVIAEIEILGLKNRVTVTGYLEDEEQAGYIAATDVPLCLFKGVSASGSLSTWIAHEKHVLATDSPEFSVYNEIAPGSITTIEVDSPRRLASSIEEFYDSLSQRNERISGEPILREELSLEKTWSKFLKHLE